MTLRLIPLARWLQQLHLPGELQRAILQLAPGETLWLHGFEGPGRRPGVDGACEISLQRDADGQYQFDAIWSIGWGSRRHTMIAVFGDFRLDDAQQVVFPDVRDVALERSFRRACRYAHRWVRQAGLGAGDTWQGLRHRSHDGPPRIGLATVLAVATE